MSKKQKTNLIRILAAALLVAAAFLPLPLPDWGKAALTLAAYLIVGYDVLIKAVKGILRGQAFDENFLMAVATLGAVALADYREAAAVMLFYQIGELFQSVAVGKSRRSIAALMDIRPDRALVQTPDGDWEEMDPEEVEVGSLIRVKPGERVPLDGVVLEGSASLDTAALTGESMPREINPGEEISAGCIDLTGVLTVRTTKEFGDSTVAKILDLVENAASRKAKSEAFISKFARVYTPAVCGAAVLLALLPPVISLLLGADPRWGDWVYRALTFLVISCPCALVISIPLTFFAGIGGAGHAGILIKGSDCMETLAKVDCVVFDKTGTLTRGTFEVDGVHHSEDDQLLLEYAALAECFSTHPIAESLRRAWGKPLDPNRVTDVNENGGEGVIALVDGHRVAVGNRRLMERLGVEATDCHKPGTVIHVAVDGAYGGHILIADQVKPQSKEALAELQAAGVKRTVMLTGDRQAAAEEMARTLGLTEVQAELLPDGKVEALEKLLKDGGRTAFVGDGLNDAPVLSRADIGIAMGAAGVDAAIEAADVVLMDDDPRKVARGIRIARRCMRIVYENIWFAVSVKLICLVLGALGLADMWLAVFADVGVMVIAVLNAIRALRVK